MEGVNIELTMPISIKEEGGYYITSCKVLDIHSQGKTKKKAISNIIEAVQLFIETCYEMGTLDEVLKDAGLHVSKMKARRIKRDTSISVPLCLAG